MPKNKQQEAQEKRLQKNIRQAKKTGADAKQGKTKSARSKPSKKGGFFAGLKADAPQTVQQSIPYREMYRDGICRLTDTLYTKTVQFFDINYQLAQADDKAQIFEGYCDFLNYFDASIHVQLTFINQRANKAFYSLDRDEGIEREILQKPLNPAEIWEQRQMTELIYKGLSKLPVKQRQRIYAHFFLGMSKADIAKAEGTHKSRITRSIEAGLRSLEKYFKEIL